MPSKQGADEQTTSLPLLLLSSLGDNGTLEPLIGKDDTLSEALKRGEVYLLLNTLVCNLCRFSFGPCERVGPRDHSARC